jgi:hypothetical protein
MGKKSLGSRKAPSTGSASGWKTAPERTPSHAAGRESEQQLGSGGRPCRLRRRSSGKDEETRMKCHYHPEIDGFGMQALRLFPLRLLP